MSHYTVTVRLPNASELNSAENLEAALTLALAPYEESPDAGSPYLVFKDMEDEYRTEYETESYEMVRCPSGEVVMKHDDRFRTPGTDRGTFGGGSHKVPPDHELVQVPWRERFATLEAYAKEWLSAERDQTHGRFGYDHNPNAKWDWWTIGGRWTGFFPVKPRIKPRLGKPGTFNNKPEVGRADVVRVDQIDFDEVSRLQREQLGSFIAEYRRWLAGEKFPAFEGPRSTMLDLGIIKVVEGPHVAGPGELVRSWAEEVRQGDDRATWTDVARVLSDDDLARYATAFNPIKTYAALDEHGWHAPGRVGWFGCSTEEPDQYLAFADAFHERFIKAAKHDDLLVVVDCHI